MKVTHAVNLNKKLQNSRDKPISVTSHQPDSITSRLRKRRDTAKYFEFNKLINSIRNHHYDSDETDSFDADLENEIADIKNRKYFVVPNTLASDRYVSLFKMVLSLRSLTCIDICEEEEGDIGRHKVALQPGRH